MTTESNAPPLFDDADRILEIDDTVDDVTEIRTLLQERTPRNLLTPAP
jgi:hypothetical protein